MMHRHTKDKYKPEFSGSPHAYGVGFASRLSISCLFMRTKPSQQSLFDIVCTLDQGVTIRSFWVYDTQKYLIVPKLAIRAKYVPQIRNVQI